MKIILFLVISFSVSAQIKGIVVDEHNNPIPYVNIWVDNENIGTTSQYNGTFTINVSDDKIVVFSAVGFETKKVKASNGVKVILKDTIYKLDEVVIEKRKETVENEIGDSKKIRHTHSSGDKPWIYAKLFNYEEKFKETPFIKSIVFYSESEIQNAKLKIRVFQFQDSIPTNDLIEEDIIVSVKKGSRKNIIDISKYKLKIPEDGIVIGLEWLIIPENFYDHAYRDFKTKKMIAMPNYEPSLVINYFENEKSFRYTGGKWIKEKMNKTNFDKPWYFKVKTPAINLILTN